MVSYPLLYTGNPHTHTDQYLQWDSHHHLSAKYSVITTLIHRAKTVCSNPELLQKEMQHLRKALNNYNDPKWALDKVEKRLTRSTNKVNDRANSQGTAGTQPTTNEVKTKDHIVILYTQASAKALKGSVGGMVYTPTSKVITPSKTYSFPPRTKIPWPIKVGPYTSSSVECIWETSRTFGERCQEHLKDPSPIHLHSSNTGHPTTQQNLQIIGKEGHCLARNIKESIFISVNNLPLKKNIGKFNLPHIWDRILLNTPDLILKRHVPVVGNANSSQPNIPTHLNQPNALHS